MTTTAEIPQSSALSEASVDSLAELMSRDPEGYTRQDLSRVVDALRAMRAKWEAAEAAAPSKPRGPKATVSPQSLVSGSKAEELGL